MIKTVLTNQPSHLSSSDSAEETDPSTISSSYRSANESAGTLLALIDKLKGELTSAKQAKNQLVSLYKVKCKSDLDKSAKITKLRLQFEGELNSFCQHDQQDLVRYLQRQLLVRDQRLAEQAYEIEQLRNVGATDGVKKRIEPVQILRGNDPDLVTSTVSRLFFFLRVLCVAISTPCCLGMSSSRV